MSDWRYALRTLARSPGFTSVAVLSLALGIGANAAIYSVVRTVLLDPLPVRAPQELMAVGWHTPTPTRGVLSVNSTAYRDERGVRYNSNVSYALFRDFQRVAGADLFAFSYAANDVSASFAGQPATASGLLVSGNFQASLDVPTVLGRPIDESDDRPGAPPVVVLTNRFWRRALGGDLGVLQRSLQLNGAAFTIVGVTAPGFYGMSRGGPFFSASDLILPLSVEPLVYTRSTPRSLFDADDHWWLQVMTRVAPGASPAPLETALNASFRGTLSSSAMPALRDAGAGRVRLFPAPKGIDSFSTSLGQPLLILGIVVGLVLLIACVNVGNLMLVRGVARQKELSIRVALGAGRWRLVRGLLAESLLLAAGGGALGILVGAIGGRALLATLVAGASRNALNVAVDRPLLGAVALASVVAALLFSALPALRAVRGRIAPILRQVTAGASAPRFQAGRVLMAMQVAVSLPLLVGAALFLRTVYNLGRVELGFNAERLLIFHVDPALSGYDADRIERLYGQAVQRLDAIPGVASTTLADVVPISRLQNNWTFVVPGAGPRTVQFVRIGPAYFETFGIPLVAGRTIGVRDHSRAPRVAVINEIGARTLFGSDSAIGQTVTMQFDPPTVFEIVGIVKDSRYTSPRDPMPPTIYLPYGQTTLGRLGPMNVVLRSTVAPQALGGLIKSVMTEVDRHVAVTDLRTQADQIDQTIGTERTFMRLLLTFGAFALALASIGLHGVTSYTVVRRTSEIGVRVALGAQRRDVLWLILRQAIGVTAAGLAIGVPAAIAAARLIRASLYGVEPADPASVAAAVVVMSLVSMAAAYMPARRAVALDPLAALRHD